MTQTANATGSILLVQRTSVGYRQESTHQRGEREEQPEVLEARMKNVPAGAVETIAIVVDISR